MLAHGLKDAAEMIVGPQERVLAIGMQPGADLAGLRREVERAVTMAGQGGAVLVLADVLGGSPANVSASLARANMHIICGANLPMLLDLLTLREHASVEELKNIAIQAAKEGIIDLKR
jgi:PTS system mannose-specific IIA component